MLLASLRLRAIPMQTRVCHVLDNDFLVRVDVVKAIVISQVCDYSRSIHIFAARCWRSIVSFYTSMLKHEDD